MATVPSPAQKPPAGYQEIQSHYCIYGNASIRQASIIWILEEHNPNCRQWNAKLVDSIFREVPLPCAPLILVEKTPIGEKVDICAHEMTSLIETKGIPTPQGWDLPGLREKIAEIQQRNDQFEALKQTLQKDLKNHNFQTPVLNQILAFARSKERETILELLQQGNIPLFQQKVNSLLGAIHFKHVEQMVELCRKTFPSRQKSLMRAIDAGIASNGIVMPHTGTFHGIRNPLVSDKEFDLAETNHFLRTKTFVMVLLKTIQLPIQNMPSLWAIHTVALRTLPNSPSSSSASSSPMFASNPSKTENESASPNAASSEFSQAEQLRIKGLEKGFDGAISNNPQLNRVAAIPHVFIERLLEWSSTITTEKVDTYTGNVQLTGVIGSSSPALSALPAGENIADRAVATPPAAPNPFSSLIGRVSYTPPNQRAASLSQIGPSPAAPTSANDDFDALDFNIDAFYD